MPHDVNFFPMGKYPLTRDSMESFSRKLHEKFDELHGKEVYARINLKKNDDSTEEYQVSLTTKNMIQQDHRFIELTSSEVKDSMGFLQGYHPFFFEFYGEKCGDKDISKFTQKWKKAKLYFLSGKTIDHQEYTLQGTVIFGASPLVRKKACLVFVDSDEELNYKAEFSSLLTLSTLRQNNVVRDWYERQWSAISSIKCDVWNAGQANCVSLILDQVEVFFDVGLPIHSNSCESECFAQEHMRRATPSGIVLSHWDLDHVLGVTVIGTECCKVPNYNVYTNCFWIAPDLSLIKSRSLSAERLCYYLLRQRMIWLINHVGQNTPVIQQGGSMLSLWQGNGRESNGGIKNNIGLIIKIDNQSMPVPQHVLLTGDCAYEALPEFLKETRYCVVLSPHHGSEQTISNISAEDHNARAIISVGENIYYHPRIEHIAALLRQGFRIHFTAGCRKISIFCEPRKSVYIRRNHCTG